MYLTNIQDNRKLPYIIISDFEKPIKLLIDSGSHISLLNPYIAKKYFSDFIIIKPNIIKTSCGQQESKYEAHIPGFKEFNTKDKIIFTLFDFHPYFDGLISFRDLKNMGFNWNLQQNYLVKSNATLPVHQCSPSDYNCFNITLNENEILKTRLPTNAYMDGTYYIPYSQLNYHCFIPEGIACVRNGHAMVEIHNVSQDDTYISLYQPIEVFSLEDFQFGETQMENSNFHADRNEIVSLLRLEHLNEEEKMKITKLCTQFLSIFQNPNEPLSSTTQTCHNINTTDEEPIYTKSYRLPQVHKEEVKQQIKKMLEDGIIRNSTSPWSSPIWIVPKKLDASGVPKWRLVIDYRKLNLKTIQDRFPIPNIDDLLDKLGKCQYFSTLDLASGFHQIRIHEDSIEKTAFSTEQGHYEFLRMPFGLKNAPASFQRMINEILKNYINRTCLVYMDDIIIFSTTLDEHIQNLKEIFKKLQEHNLKVQLDKCEFLKKETEFLGHVITPESIRPNPKKIDAILKIPLPKTHKEVKSFLGMIGFYRKFINNLAKLTKPLTACLRKGKRIEHSQEFVQAFETCKTILCNEPILVHPDFSKVFTLTTDASKFAIGSVLSQNGKPVCYASRTLNPNEINYSVTEKELLAIIWSVKYFRPYLFGRHFLIKTDHRPLKWLESLKEPNSKLVRWKLLLSEYDYEIDYIKGKENYVADTLSRNIEETPNTNLNAEKEKRKPPSSLHNEPGDIDMSIQDFLENHITTVHSVNEPPLLSYPYCEKPLNYYKHQMIVKMSDSSTVPRFIKEKIFENNRYYINFRRRFMDEDLEEFIANLKNNVTYHLHFPNKEDEKFFLRHIQEKINRISSKLMICSSKITDVTIQSEQQDKLNYHHVYKTGHRGITTTLESLKKNYYWPTLVKDVTNYINNCVICQKSKYERNPNEMIFQAIPIGSKPFARIHIDTLSISNNKFLTLIDTFSKFAQVYDIPGINAVNILDGLLNFISHYGLPEMIICDNGIEFNNNNFTDFCKLHKIAIHYTTPKNPNSNSYIERFHSTLLEQIRVKTQQYPKESLNNLIKYSLIHYNNSIHSVTEHTPFEIITGHFNSKDPFDIEEKHIVSKYVEEHKEKIKDKYKEIKGNMDQKKHSQLEKINKNRKDPITLSEDDNIYHKELPRDKLAPRFTKLNPVAQTSNKVKTDTSKYSKHNIKRRKKHQ